MDNNFQFPNNQGWQPQPMYGNFARQTQPPMPTYGMQPQPTTNINLVTSIEEALYRANIRNADLVFFNQDKDVFYRVKVDMEGKKTWAAFPYTAENQPDSTPVTKGDLKLILDKLETVEAALMQSKTVSPEAKTASRKRKVEEVADNGELDG